MIGNRMMADGRAGVQTHCNSNATRVRIGVSFTETKFNVHVGCT